jgi:DNA-binding FadR family transcriptional regulator
MLQPLPPARNLTSEVVERIASEIRGGGLAPGSRLPT